MPLQLRRPEASKAGKWQAVTAAEAVAANTPESAATKAAEFGTRSVIASSSPTARAVAVHASSTGGGGRSSIDSIEADADAGAIASAVGWSMIARHIAAASRGYEVANAVADGSQPAASAAATAAVAAPITSNSFLRLLFFEAD
jgi:hypothetical protein